MTPLSASVVVASRGRPEALSLCLTGLAQLQYHPFEIVVVADPPGLAAVKRHPLGPRLKLVGFDEPNLSAARNLGIRHAAGAVVAFIDDDAVPYPDWLSLLIDPFADGRVAAAGGFVVGRNGISLQWGARSVDREGWHHSLTVPDGEPSVPKLPSRDAIRTEGTCMAIRRKTLVSLGGFDEAFRYYMDDTDLNMRLAASGACVAIAPQARVWHHQAKSQRRDADRTPRDLFEIGASTAAFLDRHADATRRPAALAAHRSAQRHRLLRHLVTGKLMPGDVARLIRGFDDGAAEGRLRARALADLSEPLEPFRPISDQRPEALRESVSGWIWQRRRLDRECRQHLESGALVHAMRLTPTALYHRRRYVAAGYWLQTGGLFGRSERGGPLVHAWSFKDRVRHESRCGPVCRRFP